MNPSDGDTDAIASTRVPYGALGVFSASAILTGGSSCSVTATDTSEVTFTTSHPNDEVVVVCYVRVCEELPVATVAVCSVTTFTVTVRPPQLLKDGFEDIE